MASPKSCAILGHNPMRFAWGFDEEAAECHDMKMELAQQIMVLRQQGVTHFSVACDYGVGLYAAEIINALRTIATIMFICFGVAERQRASRESKSCDSVRFRLSASKYVGETFNVLQSVTKTCRLGVFAPDSICLRYVALMLQASDSRSLVQPLSFRAVLIRFPSNFLSI